MIVLAFGSALGGLVLLFVLDIEGWLAPITGFAVPSTEISSALLIPITLATVVIGVFIAWRQYATGDVAEVAPSTVSVATKASRNDLYFDSVNEAVFMRPGLYLTRWLVWFDNKAIDGAVHGIASAFGSLSGFLRKAQTGYARQYAMTMVGGAVLVAGTLALVRLA
jgi:NADH-quinone oxidoreductase subunit L